MKSINYIILHCSDSVWGSAREIEKWHKARGWAGIGYHYVITNGWILPKLFLNVFDGSIECGRILDEDAWIEENEIGSHTLGLNAESVGVCLIGVSKFSELQMTTARGLVWDLGKLYGVPYSNVLGHYETPSGKAQGKTCPNFDMKQFRESLLR